MRAPEKFLSYVLLGGLLLALLVSGIGCGIFLWLHPDEIFDYRVFKAEPVDLTKLSKIILESFQGNSLQIMQLGILLLVATPIARVASCIVMFAYLKDYLYIFISILVLFILLASILLEPSLA